MHASLDECDRDVIPALLKLAESGVVDPKRMTVVGFGHGAPFAIELMISSGILRNGCVAGGSLAALLSPELLLRGASYVNLERMKAPLLIVGPSDFVSNPSTQVILDFLRRLKRSPRYLDFGSSLTKPESWNTTDQTLLYHELVSYLGGAPLIEVQTDSRSVHSVGEPFEAAPNY
jgi:hypothetical protein